MIIKIVLTVYIISILYMIYEYKHAYHIDNDYCED